MIRARCHPALRALLPEPVPAAPPEWLRAMSSEAHSPLAGGAVRTLKHCPPLIDAMRAGILLPLAADLHVAGGEVRWDWDPPVLLDSDLPRAPVGVHVPEQAAGAPFADGRPILKFTGFWTLEADGPLLFTHPLNREDLPFRTLSGVVDRWPDGHVHLPAVLDPSFEGTIARGTPVAQVVELGGAAGSSGLEVGVQDATAIARARDLSARLEAERGLYRRR